MWAGRQSASMGTCMVSMVRARRTPTSRKAFRLTVPVAALALLAAACGAGETSAPIRNFDVPDTVALGRLPEPLSNIGTVPTPPTTPVPTAAPTTEPVPEPVAGAIADSVIGTRVLLIGDSVLASTSLRNDGTMCEVLASFGWTVEIAAEPGRFIEFGDVVLDQRLEPSDGTSWDVAGVMLGNQFDGDLGSVHPPARGVVAAPVATPDDRVHAE